MRIVAIDWSGSRHPAYQRRHIWRADAIDGEVVSLRAGRTRDELVDDLIGTAAGERDGLVVGLDFAFSLPSWYLEELALDASGLWERLAREALTPAMETIGLASWIERPEPPFWKAARPAATAGRELRRTELETRAPGIQPQSVFKLVGAGQVGPGSLYGMQALHRLRAAGFAIWPFDAPAFPLVVEIYPRVLVGRLSTRAWTARSEYLAQLPVDPGIRAAAAESVDAFDALVSVVHMDQHRGELSSLTARPEYALEGKIWVPVVGEYVAAWNASDPARRGALLRNACTEDVRYVDPETDVTGLDALSGVIESFQSSYPGHVLRLVGGVDAHHDVLRFAWLVERSDGTTLSAGLDACRRAPDGRLAVIAGFFGEP